MHGYRDAVLFKCRLTGWPFTKFTARESVTQNHSKVAHVVSGCVSVQECANLQAHWLSQDLQIGQGPGVMMLGPRQGDAEASATTHNGVFACCRSSCLYSQRPTDQGGSGVYDPGPQTIRLSIPCVRPRPPSKCQTGRLGTHQQPPAASQQLQP